MTIKMREFHWEKNFDTVRNFLIEIWEAGPLYRNWIPSMFENRMFGPRGTEYEEEEDEFVKMWENDIEKIVAVSITKPSGECWIHIHPAYLSVEREILDAIEKYYRGMKIETSEPSHYFFVVEEKDIERSSMLKDIGFEKSDAEGVSQIHPMTQELPEIHLQEGYSIRSANMIEEHERYRAVQKAVFPHIKEMSKNQLEIYASASFYEPELDIVAVDQDGNYAAFCTGRIDPINKLAELEPVGTHPNHRKKGLAKAVIIECLRRL